MEWRLTRIQTDQFICDNAKTPQINQLKRKNTQITCNFNEISNKLSKSRSLGLGGDWAREPSGELRVDSGFGRAGFG